MVRGIASRAEQHQQTRLSNLVLGRHRAAAVCCGSHTASSGAQYRCWCMLGIADRHSGCSLASLMQQMHCPATSISVQHVVLVAYNVCVPRSACVPPLHDTVLAMHLQAASISAWLSHANNNTMFCCNCCRLRLCSLLAQLLPKVMTTQPAMWMTRTRSSSSSSRPARRHGRHQRRSSEARSRCWCRWARSKGSSSQQHAVIEQQRAAAPGGGHAAASALLQLRWNAAGQAAHAACGASLQAVCSCSASCTDTR